MQVHQYGLRLTPLKGSLVCIPLYYELLSSRRSGKERVNGHTWSIWTNIARWKEHTKLSPKTYENVSVLNSSIVIKYNKPVITH